jgi:hypothetical protein
MFSGLKRCPIHSALCLPFSFSLLLYTLDKISQTISVCCALRNALWQFEKRSAVTVYVDM